MTTKVKPTVEKWELDFDEAFEGTMCDGTGVDYGETQREVKDFIRTLLAHSVQEAKAEERARCLSTIMLWRPYFYERKVTKGDKGELMVMFDELSTLNTKEEK